MPLAAICQDSQSGEVAPAERPEVSYKYDVYAGYAYTTLDQLNASRNGLQGGTVAVTRNFGKYFGVQAEGGIYKYPYDATNPGNPSVTSVLFGPVLHAELFRGYSALIYGLLGGEHTGGESMSPSVSLAGGVGGGLEYKLSQHFAMRAVGEDVAASFTFAGGNSPLSGLSPHRAWDPRAAFGVVYKF
jgi:hypothetical protein